MKKRIKEKIQKKREKLFGHIVILGKYYCDECGANFSLRLHESLKEKTIKYLEDHKVLCPICKNELKMIQNESQGTN